MRILHVLAQMPSCTGSGVYFQNVIEGLKQYGHAQRAVFAGQDGSVFCALPPSEQYPVLFKSEEIQFPICGMSDVMPYESTVYGEMDDAMIGIWTQAFMRRLVQAKREFQPEVVVLHHLWMLTSLAVKVFSGQVKIGICHNTDIRQAEKHPHLKHQHVANLQKLDRVLALSDSQKREITSVFSIAPEKIMTMGGGVNEKLFYPTEKAAHDRVEIVYAGKIDRSKGVFELVKAFAQVCKTTPDLHLSIVGSPNAQNARIMEELVAGHGCIERMPAMRQEELAGFIRNKDLFVMPSYYEGLGLMAIESLSSGLWTVATEIEGLMSLLGEKVNASGVIEYVPLPRLYDVDKPFEEDLDDFVQALAGKLLKQIEKVKRGDRFPETIWEEINKHAWGSIIERMQGVMGELTRARGKGMLSAHERRGKPA